MGMKSLNVAVMVMAFTMGIAAAGLFYFGPLPAMPEPPEGEPSLPPDKATEPALEMVFVLDTTGSMGGLLDGAKEKIWSIVNDVQQRESRPSVRVGLVAYRDRGDAYVTQITPSPAIWTRSIRA